MRESISNSGIDPNRIDRRARSVLGRLRSAGYDAWIVGGAVRDLLLGRRPKDFDVATDALPEEICSVFARARIVGRRFKIVHVVHGRHVTEVSTYRTSHDKDQAKVASSFEELRGQARVVSTDGVILRDNAWGNQQEDALRRDFTINAFYYDPFNDDLIDFCSGYADLRSRSLRLIGNPEARFIEDPVRILRALRISAKLGLSIERHTASAMRTCKDMIEKVSPRRKYDECVKLLMNGHAEKSWNLAEDFGLIDLLFPTSSPRDSTLIHKALQNTDHRVSDNRPVTFAFLLSVVYFSGYQLALERQDESESFDLRHTQAGNDALNELRGAMAIPRYASMFVRDVWALQSRLESCKRAQKTLALERFRAGYDLLHLRAETGSVDSALHDWWQAFQESSGVSQPPNVRKRRYARTSYRRTGTR
ncbi:MAG: polynucleotide adenylyltransferase PcnB [Gammaproteobacteria bacterium]|nr:polynucleotide adenylyltransferase PcnB [Gammaproteobacteria bacterium]MCY4198510.1 polynucleotide adenylyltransferase PcnB [Gammaproteobacteria bacterium]MCY4276459.1 polynucleotide adenylyltransferase PcnB [Gammaproteobacteria bacterium]MCY4322434.1 polynucleotide adenylyltransferase PcnB [Gammaproteobacteria bacterium]